MVDILQNFTVNADRTSVFSAISTPEGLNSWWTLSCSGKAEEGAEYTLGFGPAYNWRARATRCDPDAEFELALSDADSDWQGTRMRFVLNDVQGRTEVSFQHTGWPEDNDHYRTSCFCWAMYLRLMKRFVEFGEVIPYDRRLEV